MGQRQREYFSVLLSPMEKIAKVLQSVDRHFSPKENHILARQISHPWPMPMIICRAICQQIKRCTVFSLLDAHTQFPFDVDIMTNEHIYLSQFTYDWNCHIGRVLLF